MECLWVKRGNGLAPFDPVTAEMLDGLAEGARVTTDAPRRRRNPEFHRLMILRLNAVVQNTHPRFADLEALIDWLKLKSGMVEEVDMKDGRVRLRFQSISFASMDEIKFRAVTDQWREIILAEFGIDILNVLEAA